MRAHTRPLLLKQRATSIMRGTGRVMQSHKKPLLLALSVFWTLVVLSMLIPSVAEAKPPRPRARRTVRISHATPAPTRTSTPVGAKTPTPTPVPPGTSSHPCGVDSMHWHASVVSGCQTQHEHGDAPPAWIRAAGYDVSFVGIFNTSEKEDAPFGNNGKHVSMKGVLFPPFSVNGSQMDVYLRAHFSGMPFERAGEVHSIEYWVRYRGEVSHFMQWVVTGANVLGKGRCRRDPNLGFDECNSMPATQQGKIEFMDQGAFNAGVGGEQWYANQIVNARTPLTSAFGDNFLGFGLNVEWEVLDEPVIWQPYELDANANLFDTSRWKTVPGNLGVSREIDALFYMCDQCDPRRGASASQTDFITDQFGQWAYFDGSGAVHRISSLSDPYCSTTIGGDNFAKTYAVKCLTQHIAASFPRVWRTDRIDRNYNAAGIRLPN